MEFLDSLKDFLGFLFNYRDVPLSYPHIIFAFVAILVASLISFFVQRARKKEADVYGSLIKLGLACLSSFLIIWLVGPPATLFSIVFGLLFALFIRNKYFDFIASTTINVFDKNQAELHRLKKEFKDIPYLSIMEILLHYGYISPSQKELVESENIFQTPEEMAKKVLDNACLN